MPNFPIAFQSSQGRYRFEGVTQLVNAYAEQNRNDAKQALSVHACNGILEFVNQPDAGPCRGMIYLKDLDKLYTIHPSSAYKVTFDGTTATSVRIGTVPGFDLVQLSRNQNASPQVFVQAETVSQVLASDSLAPITDADYPTGVITADYVDGYTVVGTPDRHFNISGINQSTTWDALDFDVFSQRAGTLTRVAESNGELIGLCDNSIEFWRNTGNADFPFEAIGARGHGMRAPNALVRSDNTIMFPGGDDGIIYRLANYDLQRISTHSIERLIHDDADVEDMIGFAWSHDGHAFANFTGSTWSRCYDSATQAWHSRRSYGYTNWRVRHSVEAWNRTIVGDSQSGKLGYFDNRTFTEFGAPIIWGVDSPTLHVFPNGAIVDAFHMDLAVGYGTLADQGSDPKIMFQVSRDGGYTFEGYRELSLGMTGKYTTRVTARRLGRFGPQGMVFRLRISDPVVRALVGTDVELRPLKNAWRPANG
jgi:hypothetical protein